MAIAITELAQEFSDSSTETLTATIGASGVAVGSRVVVGVGLPLDATTASGADTRGNVYAVDAEESVAEGRQVVLLSAPITTALEEGDTITITFTGVSDAVAAFFVVTGLEEGGAVDQIGTGTGASAAPATSTLSTTTADEAIIGCFARAADGSFFTAGSGWTKGTEVVSTGTTLDTVYRVVSATGDYQPNGEYSPASLFSGASASYHVEGEAPAPAATGFPWNVIRRRRAR